MNTSMNNLTIEYDEGVIRKIKEMIENGLNKLQTFVKSERSNNLKYYYELDEKFNNIAKNLKKFEFLNNEFNYFISISSKILYIIKLNHENTSFGFCEYALNLFDFFIEIWEAKMNLLNNYSENEIKNYEKIQIEFKDRYWNYESKFYLEIYKTMEDFKPHEIYEIHENIRD